ncbi:hemin uptake protein HemP [Niveibacterium sp. SC-1]|uniref:hemin uptake protein HemP n=1 Tax=Niveibacterium sp. SC-1 TaxID=3135646 RepID=UPI00311E1B8F
MKPPLQEEATPAPGTDAGLVFPGAGPRVVSSISLLGNAREVLIEHEGEHYRLQRTRAGKLILTK